LDKIVVAVLLIALAVSASIAVAVAVQKQWTNQASIESFDTVGSQISIGTNPDNTTKTATVTILVHNTGTTTAYLSWITICNPCSQLSNSNATVYFVNTNAMILTDPGGAVPAATVSPSSARVVIGTAWVILPSKESIYVSFNDPNVANLMAPGDRYTAVIHSLSGNAQTFSLTVVSA
jgi:archaellum component FlaG (FlaF/FlaG flagellin family)